MTTKTNVVYFIGLLTLPIGVLNWPTLNAGINVMLDPPFSRKYFHLYSILPALTSVCFAFNWLRRRGATLTRAAQSYALAQTRNKCWFYVTSLSATKVLVKCRIDCYGQVIKLYYTFTTCLNIKCPLFPHSTNYRNQFIFNKLVHMRYWVDFTKPYDAYYLVNRSLHYD